MSGRSRLPRHPMHDKMQGFHGPPPPLPRGHGPMPPPIPAMEEEIAARHDEIRRIHTENRLLIDENIAMKRDISAAKDELHVLCQVIRKIHADKEAKAKELIQMGLKLEAELRALEPIKAEVLQLQSEAQKLDAFGQEMSAKVLSTRILNTYRLRTSSYPPWRWKLMGYVKSLSEPGRPINMKRKHMLSRWNRGKICRRTSSLWLEKLRS